MTVDGATARSDDRGPRDRSPGSSTRSAPRSRPRSRRCTGRTRRIRAASASCWPSSTAAGRGGDASAGSTCTRPSSTALGHDRRAARRSPTGRRERAARRGLGGGTRRRQVAAAHPGQRGPARGHRVPRPSRLHRVRTDQDGLRLDLAGLTPPAVDLPTASRSRPWPSGPTSSPASTRSPSRRSRDIPGGDEPMAAGDLAEFRARDVDRPAIPPGAFVIAVDRDGHRRRLRQPDPGPGQRADRLARHDCGHADMARPGARDGAQGGDHRGWAIANGLTALETGNDVDNDADAGGQRPARLPAPAGLLTMRGPLVRRHHGAVTDSTRRPDRRAAVAPLPPDPAAYDAAAQRPRARPRAAGAVHRRRQRPGPGAGPARRSATTAGCCCAMVARADLRRVRDRHRRSRSSASGGVTRVVAAARRARLDDATWDDGPRDAGRDAPRPHPDPVGQSPGARAPGRRARGRAAHRRPCSRRTASDRRSSSRSRDADRSTSACAATGPAASRSCCCRTSTSCRHRPSAGPTTRSRPTSSTATSTAAARST